MRQFLRDVSANIDIFQENCIKIIELLIKKWHPNEAQNDANFKLIFRHAFLNWIFQRRLNFEGMSKSKCIFSDWHFCNFE
jgi:hypothetical protein